MRIIVEHRVEDGTSVLIISVHDAPHRRMLVHREVLRHYRTHLVAACRRAGLVLPIADPVEIRVLFVNPTSPDLGNLYLALENALDGAVLLDDSLIQKQESSKLYVGGVEERAPNKVVPLGRDRVA